MSCLCTNRWKNKAPEEAESTVPVNRLMCIDGHVEGQSLGWAAHLRVLASREWELCTQKDRALLHWACCLCRWKDTLKDAPGDWSNQAWAELLFH